MARAKKVVILEHVPSEKAGTILDHLRKEAIRYEEIQLFEKGCLWPDLQEISALVVMGGPMNVYEEDRYPFLKEEDRFIRAAVRQDIPYLGICLGSQLLAKALGAKVMKAKAPEVGWGEVELLPGAAGSVLFHGLPAGALKVLQWHEDTFELPQGAELLATNTVVPHQAFGYQGSAFGLQFHLEVDRPLLEDWFKNRSDQKNILDEYDRYRPELSRITGPLYRNFLSLTQHVQTH